MSKIGKFLSMSKFEKKISICRNTYSFLNSRKFGKIGKKSYIYKPQFVSGFKHIFIGEKSGIWHDARIEVIDQWNESSCDPKLIIGNGVMIGQNSHITVANRVEIEDGVVCTARVTITDISHVTNDKSLPILEQGIVTKPVKICEGAFVGINSTILPGVTIGRHAIIGANSVVTKDVPDYATVVGAPAYIINESS